MPTPSPTILGLSTAASIPLLSAIVGGVLALLLFADYFRRKRAEVATIAHSRDVKVADHNAPKRPPSSSRKPHTRSHHSHAADKDLSKRHHSLDVNTLKGHGDAVTSLCFSPDGRNIATTCADGVVRIFLVDDVSSKGFKLLRINLSAGAHPTAVVFSEGASSLVVAAQVLTGSSLYMYDNVIVKPAGEGKQQSKIPPPEINWEHHKVHDMRSVLTLVGVPATYGNGTDIKLWHGKTGKDLGTVDTNQLKNNMATISPNGRFLAAAAFTADVKVWEIIYSKDGSVKEILKVMQLKGHKSAVTCLCFTPNSEQIITASKDGTIRIWNINVRYHLDEDPKTLKVFKIPLRDNARDSPLLYDRMSISPDGKILALTSGSTLQWLCAETGEVLDTADRSHEGS
ncbi:U4/U6 small nuclear ribonucleoprotein PRP4-like protein [Apostasia shenzhenica]|uniref:U4/U6 small nuclear ribonucleoprotein PRP4-like protein n=1 Tax=Apostasia shenzhenica TaxID=1088818 RepID=A0A2H9ZWR1_9ASPA|nr:U4/U6 small nuclear ribonucleoprotein PRP4-like protein [Apostasia shenzhenica]